jgi:predicted phosphodiesterase|tara:strand:+ start:1547 stop:2521 length:975 start_codon:yes stop_codon:yes gene_type:complete
MNNSKDLENRSYDRIYEIVAQYLIHGEEKASEILGIKPQSLRRNLRRAKSLGLDIERGKVLRDIELNYSKAELLAIAKGARILPGQSKIPMVEFEGDRTRIGIMGDVHFGSKYCLYELVDKAFKEFEDKNCDIVCQVGDLTEGMSNRPGQIYELSHLGYHEQKKVAIEYMSRCPRPLYMIDGNHDRWFIKSNGALIVPDICDAIEHATFLGHDEGNISLSGTATVRLWHGEDGSSYAVSYRIQKIVESLTGGQKPNVMLLGHVHKSMYLFDRHIHCYSAGAFQRQTSWMRGKRLASHTGFWIVDIYVNKTGVAKTTGTWYPFYA